MKFFYSLRNWFRSFFISDEDGPFGWSPEEFKKAKWWAMNQPHPKFPDHPRMSLWDYVSNNWIDSEYKLHEINKRRVEKLKKKRKNYDNYNITKEDIYSDLFK